MPKSRNKTRRSQPARQPHKPVPDPCGEPERAKMSGNERENQKDGATTAKTEASLTFRQQSALPIIAASPTTAQAARSSGIGESTLRRWLEDPNFRHEIVLLRQESASLARQELQGLMLRSVSVLSEAMEDPDMAIRLRAARFALSFSVQICEAERLRSDIQALQEALSHSATHHSSK